MSKTDDREFYTQRMHQELAASQRAPEELNKRLHWEMAQRYRNLADGIAGDVDAPAEPPH